MLVSVSYFPLTQTIMQEIPFSCQARKRSALCELQFSDGSAQCSGHIAHNVNSLRAEAVSRTQVLLESLANQTSIVSEIKQEDPLNLSISLSGGKEIN